MSKDYSLPDCPRVGKYDGLGMAAVPLAIKDKERERGESTNSYPSQGNYTFEEYNKEANKAYKNGVIAGRREGYSKGYLEGSTKAKLEIYKDLYTYKDTSEAEKISGMNIYIQVAESFIKKHS